MEMGAIKTPPPSARPEMTAALMAETGLNADVLRDLVHDETASIQVDSRENYLKLQQFARDYTPNVLDHILQRFEHEIFGCVIAMGGPLARHIDHDTASMADFGGRRWTLPGGITFLDTARCRRRTGPSRAGQHNIGTRIHITAGR